MGFYTRKLNSAQKNYTVGEKELLSIVEGFKTFDGVLRGSDVTVHTDHLNLLYQNMPTQRMVRWRLMLEEHHPNFVHVAGNQNAAADVLSRLDLIPSSYDEIDWEPKGNGQMRYSDTKGADKDEVNLIFLVRAMSELKFYSDEFSEDYLYPMASEREIQGDVYPLSVQLFREEQQLDEALLAVVERDRVARYTNKMVEGVALIHDHSKMYVPESLRKSLLEWFHFMLCHPGYQRMKATIKRLYVWRGLQEDVKRYVRTCHTCQMSKETNTNKYGLLPEKTGETTMWSRVNVDCWGPKTIKNREFNYEMYVMTMVDPVSGWFEYQQLLGRPTAFECQTALDNQWLQRYPR